VHFFEDASWVVVDAPVETDAVSATGAEKSPVKAKMPTRTRRADPNTVRALFET
jgi:hypothetical protein